MKTKDITILLFIILFPGCVTSFNISDFPSKQQFYQKVNADFADKEAFIVLTNDSTIAVRKSVLIENDSLFSISPLFIKAPVRFAKSDLADVSYNEPSDVATIVLKNNNILEGKDLRTLNDSVYFEKINRVNQKDFISLIQDVKKVRYKNKLLGTLTGMPAGFLIGGLLGYFLGKTTPVHSDSSIKSDQHPSSEFEQSLANCGGGAFAGLLLGGIGGYFIGYPITYEFNP